ncbi:hypothetical protein [Pyxidicoccus xibeiensis]|uniref:hypothetical protein n=1 Tax=Pyxidicoccus xibeiensis TaxID=2906759 RepID=UPI0020A8385D|nr:hypothetical protein [Pyxidicoccus xibeiensis]MCP3139409.1 hypothetical protein [Pyxidicoccus xibeiensis]
MLLLWVPVLAGFFFGRWLFPRLVRRFNVMARAARGPTASFSMFVTITVWCVAMLLTSGILGSKVLAWLQGLSFLPFTPTAGLVQAFSWFAAFFFGYSAAPLFGRAALESAAPASPAAPKKQSGGAMVFVMLSFILAAGGGLAAIFIGLGKEGFLRTSDVGDLAELASVQEQLRPLEACEVLYKRWDAKGRQKYPDSVTLRDCDSNTFSTIYIKVPTTWLEQGVGFTMERSSSSERWDILVDKDVVPFPALKEALEAFAPIIAAEYPARLQEALQREAEFHRDVEEYRRQRDAPKESVKSSYPE